MSSSQVNVANVNSERRSSGGIDDIETANLPLQVVERAAIRIQPSSKFTLDHRWIIWGTALCLVIISSIAAVGLVGLYRQPPGLQWAMQTLGLEPGGGTSTPIAVPVTRPVDAMESKQGRATIVALGKLIPWGEVVTLAPASGVRDARIKSLEVRVGDRVVDGQIVAVLDNKARLKAAVERARSTVRLRAASLEQTRSSVAASRSESKAALARAKATAARTQQDFERTKGLFDRRVVSKATYDQKLAAAREAEHEVVRLSATLSRYGFGKIDEQPDVLVALGNVSTAQAELSQAKEDLEQAYVRAPFKGTILEIHARAGEKPGEQGVAELGDISRMTAKLEVYQSQIAEVTKGSAVELSAVALPMDLNGRVERIGLQVKKQSVTDADPAANTDARIIEVLVALDDEASEIASRFTNLQVEARILPGAAE